MGFWAGEPRALPWAGMNDALGVSHMSRLPPCTSARSWLDIALEQFCPAPARTFLSASGLTDLRERTRITMPTSRHHPRRKFVIFRAMSALLPAVGRRPAFGVGRGARMGDNGGEHGEGSHGPVCDVQPGDLLEVRVAADEGGRMSPIQHGTRKPGNALNRDLLES